MADSKTTVLIGNSSNSKLPASNYVEQIVITDDNADILSQEEEQSALQLEQDLSLIIVPDVTNQESFNFAQSPQRQLAIQEVNKTTAFLSKAESRQSLSQEDNQEYEPDKDFEDENDQFISDDRRNSISQSPLNGYEEEDQQEATDNQNDAEQDDFTTGQDEQQTFERALLSVTDQDQEGVEREILAISPSNAVRTENNQATNPSQNVPANETLLTVGPAFPAYLPTASQQKQQSSNNLLMKHQNHLEMSQSPFNSNQNHHTKTQKKQTRTSIGLHQQQHPQQLYAGRGEKSQHHVRNSYSKFMATNQNGAAGTASQRNQALQIQQPPAFITPGGQANQQAEHQGRRQTRIKNKGTTAAIRSKTTKPSKLDALPSQNLQIKATGHNSNNAMHQHQSSSQLGGVTAGGMAANTKNVDLLVIGAGPAALGLMIAAVKQQKFGELLQDDGVAILDQGISFGGGMLCNYGINSNTSANSFLKCVIRKAKQDPAARASLMMQAQSTQLHQQSELLTKEQQLARQQQLMANKVNLLTATSNTAAATTNHQLVKETKSSTNKRRQKSVGKERPSNQPPQSQSDNVAAGVKPLQSQNKRLTVEGQVSPKKLTTQQAFKWVNNGHALRNNNLPQASNDGLQQQQQSDNAAENSAAADSKPIEQPSSETAEEGKVGQPQDPDMEPVEEIATPTGNDNTKQTEEVVAPTVSAATVNKSGPKTNNNLRRKSRDESSVAGRNAKKPQLTSTNRNQSKPANFRSTVGSSVKPASSVQNSLAIYTQANISTLNGIGGALAKNHNIMPKKKIWTSDDVLTPFKDIFPSNIALLFRRLNKNIVPLSLVGHLLNYVGNHLLQHAYKSAGKRIYMPNHKALSIHLMGNGDIMTQVLKTDFTILPDTQADPPTFKVIEGKQSIVYFRSKAVVITSGAKQAIDNRITQEWFPNLDPSKLIASDSFLKRQTYLQCIESLRQKTRPKVVIIGGSHSGFSCAWMLLNGPAMYQKCFKTLEKEQTQPNETSDLIQTEVAVRPKVPFATRKSIKNCVPCCTCGNAVMIATQRLAAQNAGGNTQNQRYLEELRSHSKAGQRAPRGISMAARELSPINKNQRHLSKTIKQKKDFSNLKPALPPDSKVLGQRTAALLLSPDPIANKAAILATTANVTSQQQLPAPAPFTETPAQSQTPTCSCICKCFGYFMYNEWPNLDSETNQIQMPQFQEGDIKILYRDRLKVFFKTAKDANDVGYTDFDDIERSKKKKDGYIYSFTGLRGDAKQLYLDVTNGREKRVSFIKAETPELQKTHVEDADLVIWACGYQSNAIKIHDVNKKELELSQKVANTQFDVDGKNRVMLADGNVLNKVFACGVGFPVRTKDGGIGNPDPSKNPRADSFSLYMHTVGEVLLKSLLPKKKMLGAIAHKEAANPYLKAATYEQIMKDKQYKNKKPLLQQLSTKKEKTSNVVGTGTKLGQLANPTRLPKQGVVPLLQNADLIDQQNYLQKEMTNVYMQYLSKTKPGQIISNSRPGLNSDLEDLQGFGAMHSFASKSNCFSHRTSELNEQMQDAHAIMFQTGYSEGRQQILQSQRDDKNQNQSQASGEEAQQHAPYFNEPSLKLPQIKRETPFVDVNDNNLMIPQPQQQIHQQRHSRSITELSGSLIPNVSNIIRDSKNADLNVDETDLNDRDNSMSAGVLPQGIVFNQRPGRSKKRNKQTEQYSNQNNQNNQASCKSGAFLVDQPQMVAMSQSRNQQVAGTEVLSQSIQGDVKSPLLLQKKQQMVCIQQKTRDTPAQRLPSNNNGNGISTVSNLKTGGGQKMHSGLNKNKSKATVNNAKKDKMLTATDILLAKRHQNALAHVDNSSPYLHFGNQQNGAIDQSHHHNTKRNKDHHKSKNKRGGAGAQEKVIVNEAQLVDSVNTTTTANAARSVYKNQIHGKQVVQGGKSLSSTKEAISHVINSHQKAFSERESLINNHRYKFANLQKSAGPSVKQAQPALGRNIGASIAVKNNNIKDTNHASQLASVDLIQSKNTIQLMSPDAATNAMLLKDSSNFDVIVDELGQLQQTQLQQEMLLQQQSVNNSELFPPIVGTKNSQKTTTIPASSSKVVASAAHHIRKTSINDQSSMRSLSLALTLQNSSSTKQHFILDHQIAAKGPLSKEEGDVSVQKTVKSSFPQSSKQKFIHPSLQQQANDQKLQQQKPKVVSKQVSTNLVVSDNGLLLANQNGTSMETIEKLKGDQISDNNDADDYSSQDNDFERSSQGGDAVDEERQQLSSTARENDEAGLTDDDLSERHQLPEQTSIKSAVERQASKQHMNSQKEVAKLQKAVLQRKQTSLTVGSQAIQSSKDIQTQSLATVKQLQSSNKQHTSKARDISLNKKFESVINQKSTKLIASDHLSHMGQRASLTPHKPISTKKLNDQGPNHYLYSLQSQTAVKQQNGTTAVASNQKRFVENNNPHQLTSNQSRRSGAASATDLQQTNLSSKIDNPAAKHHNQRNVAKKTNTGALYEKFIIQDSIQSNHRGAERPNGGPYFDNNPASSATNHQNSSSATTTKPIGNQNAQQNSQQRNKLSLRQRQVADSQNAKFKQLISRSSNTNNNVSSASTTNQQQRSDATSLTHVAAKHTPANQITSPNKQQPHGQTINNDERQSVQYDKAARSSKVKKAQTIQTTTGGQGDTSPFLGSKKQPSATKDSITSYKQGFFVHKTIRDLAIKPDLQHSLYDDADQIKALKKEVQSKAANLSPVLKNRGVSKTGNFNAASAAKAGVAMDQKHAISIGLNSAKYKSPVRTTSKLAMSSQTAHKDSNNISLQPQKTNHASALSKAMLMKPSFVPQHSVSQALTTSVRSPKSHSRRNNYPSQTNTNRNQGQISHTEQSTSRLRDLSSNQIQQNSQYNRGDNKASSSRPQGLSSSSNMVRSGGNGGLRDSAASSSSAINIHSVSQVQIKKDLVTPIGHRQSNNSKLQKQ